MNTLKTSSDIQKKINVFFKILTFILLLFSNISTLASAQNKTAESKSNLIPQKYRCQIDNDCILSCSQGAINRSSYQSLVDECEDGCSSKGMTVHCVNHLCVAFRFDGKKEESCTLKENKK